MYAQKQKQFFPLERFIRSVLADCSYQNALSGFSAGASATFFLLNSLRIQSPLKHPIKDQKLFLTGRMKRSFLAWPDSAIIISTSEQIILPKTGKLPPVESHHRRALKRLSQSVWLPGLMPALQSPL